MAAAAGPVGDAIRLCAVMPELHVEAFRASIMIVASFGLYSAVSGHDHETAEPRVLP
jgi:hypothetical protein